MTYEEIIKEVTSKLSGDNEKDIRFLIEEAKKYKDHECEREISKAIFRIVAKRLPDSEKGTLQKEVVNIDQFMDIILEEVKFKIKEEHAFDEAERLLKTLLPFHELVSDDKVSEYFSFNNLIEWMYYEMKYKPSKEIRHHPTANLAVYFFYAYIFFERKDYAKALEMLDKGLALNPLSTNFLFEKSEIFKVRKDWPKFKELTDNAIEYAYTCSDLARAYRNYGYMFIEKEDYDGAIACYIYSSFWHEDKIAQNELYHISKKTKKIIDEEYYRNNLLKILQDRQISIEPNKEILAIIYSLAEKFFQEDNLDESLYYYKILYDLVRDKDIYAKIQIIEGNIKGTA